MTLFDDEVFDGADVSTGTQVRDSRCFLPWHNQLHLNIIYLFFCFSNQVSNETAFCVLFDYIGAPTGESDREHEGFLKMLCLKEETKKNI